MPILANWARAAGFAAVLIVALGLSYLWALQDVLMPMNPPYWSFPQCETGKANPGKEAQNKQQQPNEASHINQIEPSPKHNSHDANDIQPSHEKFYECLIAEFTRKLAIATKWLVIVTGLLALVTTGLVGSAIKQIADARSVQRAHVFATQPKYEFVFEGQTVRAMQVSIAWKNSGTTPALDVSTIFGVTYVPNGQMFPFGQGGDRRQFVLRPGAETSNLTLEISGDHVGAVAEGAGQQFIWGVVTYTDVFSPNTEHVTEFCYEFILLVTRPIVALASLPIANTTAITHNGRALARCSQHQRRPVLVLSEPFQRSLWMRVTIIWPATVMSAVQNGTYLGANQSFARLRFMGRFPFAQERA